MEASELELQKMLRLQQRNELSSEEEERDEVVSRSQYRKPIKNPFSDEGESDSSEEIGAGTASHFPPKPVKSKTVVQQAQERMKWEKEERGQVELLARLEGSGMKEKKIKELANKYKALNIAYEKEKTVRKNFQAQLNAFVKKSDETIKEDKKQSLEKSILKAEGKGEGKAEGKGEKCGNCGEQEKKIMEMRLKNQTLKSELNKAHRVIARQMGEDFNIDQALGEENAWKGRQQKIEKLKSRVKDLQERLQGNGVNVSHMSGFTQMTETTIANRTGNFSTTRSSALAAENKRKELDNLKVQVDALRSENDSLQTKVKSLAARKTTLESEAKDLRTDFDKKKQLYLEKSENDDKFIALLKQENQKLKREEKVVTKVIYKDSKENTEEVQVVRGQPERRKLRSTKGGTQEGMLQQPLQKALNEVTREGSAEKKRQVAEEYLKGSSKYLKKLSAEDEEEIYRAWKQSKGKP